VSSKGSIRPVFQGLLRLLNLVTAESACLGKPRCSHPLPRVARGNRIRSISDPKAKGSFASSPAYSSGLFSLAIAEAVRHKERKAIAFHHTNLVFTEQKRTCQARGG